MRLSGCGAKLVVSSLIRKWGFRQDIVNMRNPMSFLMNDTGPAA